MIDLVREKIGDRSKSSVRTIELKECTLSSIEGLEDLVNLESLSITGCNLDTLEGFPKLPQLKVLDVSGNSLKSSLEHLVGSELRHLDLSNNLFSSLSDLDPLAEIITLKVLNVRGCPISECVDYRSQIFDMLNSVDVIDGEDRISSKVLSLSDEFDSTEGSEVEEEPERFKDLIMNREYSETDEPDDPSFKPDDDEVSCDDDEYDSEEDNEGNGSLSLATQKPSKRTHKETLGEDVDDVAKK